MRGRGFSLLELVVAMSIFLVLSVLIFSFFRYGTRSFAQANARHGIQNVALRAAESLQYELKRTNVSSVTVLNDSSRQTTVDGETVRRDAICMAGLQKWHDRTNFNNYDPDTGAPKWNRYWVVYANRNPEGQLIKLKVDPGPPPEVPIRLPRDDIDDLVHDDPALNTYSGETPGYVVLAQSVKQFAIDSPADTGNDFYDIAIKLKEKHTVGATEGAQRREFDFYEIKLSIKPENSYPN